MEFGIGMFGDVNIDLKNGSIQSSGERMKEIIEEVQRIGALRSGGFLVKCYYEDNTFF